MAHMARLDDSKARLERVLGRFEAAALKMHGVAAENQRLSGLLAKSAEAQRVLSLAAADALAEVDQAIAMIAGQADTAGSVPVEAPDDLPGELGFEGAEQDEAQASPDQNPSAGDAIGGLMLSLGVTQPAQDAGSAEASPSQDDDAGTAGDLPPEQDDAGEDKQDHTPEDESSDGLRTKSVLSIDAASQADDAILETPQQMAEELFAGEEAFAPSDEDLPDEDELDQADMDSDAGLDGLEAAQDEDEPNFEADDDEAGAYLMDESPDSAPEHDQQQPRQDGGSWSILDD